MSKKICLITGISSGLGKALIEEAIKKGYYAIGTMRNQNAIDTYNENNSGLSEAIKLDLTEIESIPKTINKILEKHSRIDVLINNAGAGFAGAIEEASLEEIRNIFEVNFFGTLHLTQSVLPYMRKQRNGQIVQISSHAGIKAFAGFGIYNASKFALEGFSEALAQEVQPLGIKVLIVEPIPFRTNFAGSSLILAVNQIEDYQETAGNFRSKLLSVHNKQEGNPIKAAEIIINQLQTNESSLRLPLGKIPLTTIKMKIDSLVQDLDKNRDLAALAVF